MLTSWDTSPFPARSSAIGSTPGQCRDCFQPSFNYRPKSAAQYIMAIRNFDDPDAPKQFELGFMASSDNHTSRPGTGYKEYGRPYNTESLLTQAGTASSRRDHAGDPYWIPRPVSIPYDPRKAGGAFFNLREAERGSSFFLTGGLIAVHAQGRNRDQIWDAMQRREKSTERVGRESCSGSIC